MVLIELFLSFVKIGFTSFGGTSMVPLIMQEMTSHGWMSSEDLSNLIAIAEITPGPLGVNCATFAGTRTAGFFGGCMAVLGVLAPTLTLTLAASLCFKRFKDSVVMGWILRVIKPVCIAIIFSVCITLSMENYVGENGLISLPAIAIGVIAFLLLKFAHWSVPRVLIVSAVLGALTFSAVPLLLAL